MRLLIDSLGRALAYCLHWRVIAWSLFPFVLMAALAALLGYGYWTPAITWAQELLGGVGWLHQVWLWLGLERAPEFMAPVLVVLLAMPVIVVLALLLVALFMTPHMVELVAARRFAGLERKQGGNWWRSLVWSLGSTAIALVALVVSVPLWFVPPLMLILPPLIWGWLTYRVMAFDALAAHASKEERRLLFVRHRYSLMFMGVLCGYLGTAPGIVWASGVVFVAAFWVLIPLAIWIYAFVFALSSLWFAHYGLAALAQLRAEQPAPVAPAAASSPEAEPPAASSSVSGDPAP